jgi:hypothetical protein
MLTYLIININQESKKKFFFEILIIEKKIYYN